MAEVCVKFDPFTVRVNSAPPGAELDGLKDDSTGAGVAEIENVAAFELPALGVLTVMLAVPEFATRPALTVAVS